MSFTAYEFVFLFLPLVVAGVFFLSKLKNDLYKKLFLIAASLVFYAWASPAGLLWLLLSSLVTYLLARTLTRTAPEQVGRRKLLLFFGVLFHVLFLSFFKYVDLSAIRTAAGEFAALILVPMGVSFFTFQYVVCLVEVYRGRDAVKNPLDFALYSTFFVYRTMGPIQTHADFSRQLSEGGALTVTSDNLARGIYQFILGAVKKVVLADTLAVMASGGFALKGELSFFAAWGAALAYAFQLYFDFSGYSDMAHGIARMLGFILPQNFDSPYKSESITVFWRRWHMTLGRALTTSVYISLGGNRAGYARTLLNLFLVMAVSGIWHGDTVNFLLWGAAHGLLLVFERAAQKPLDKIPLFLRRIGTFLCVTALWVPFRAPTLEGALRIWRGMVNVGNLGLSQFASIVQDSSVALPSAIALLYGFGQLALSAILCFCFKNSYEKAEKMRFTTATCLFLSVLFFLALIHMSRASVFLYENF